MAGNKGIVSAQFYKFSAANKTITFSNDYAGLDLGEITYITNIKNGVATVIYDPFDATKGGTLSGLTLTLAYDTTLMADTDPLQIITGFTPLNADPLPVRIVEGPDQVDDTALLQNISDNLDFLNLALDQNEGIQVNTRDVSIKKDIQGAIVSSDSPTPIEFVMKHANDQIVIDTTGYQSTVFHLLTNSPYNASIQFEGANDPKLGWTVLPNIYYSAATSGLIGGTNIGIIANNQYTFSTANLYRFIRIRFSSYITTGSTITGVAYLRSSPFISPILNNPVNISQIAGTAPSANSINSAGGTGAFNGGIGIAGYLPHTYGNTLSPAGQTLGGSVPNAVGIGGREAPYIGQLGGLLRYFNLDNRGNLIIGGDTAFRTPNMGGALEQSQAGTARGIGGIHSNIVGAQSLTVTNVAQDFGDTQVMLMRQILTELKILNQQFAEMPNILNTPSYELSEPQEYRNDPTFDANN